MSHLWVDQSEVRCGFYLFVCLPQVIFGAAQDVTAYIVPWAVLSWTLEFTSGHSWAEEPWIQGDLKYIQMNNTYMSRHDPLHQVQVIHAWDDQLELVLIVLSMHVVQSDLASVMAVLCKALVIWSTPAIPHMHDTGQEIWSCQHGSSSKWEALRWFSLV